MNNNRPTNCGYTLKLWQSCNDCMIDNNLWKFDKNRMLNFILGEWPLVFPGRNCTKDFNRIQTRFWEGSYKIRLGLVPFRILDTILCDLIRTTAEQGPKTFKTEPIRKLSNFNFQWTKILYQNNLKHITFFFTFFESYGCNLLSVITPKTISYGSPRKYA